MQLYNYKFTLNRVVDGDTFIGDIDLGFNIVQRDQRIRLYGVNAPETRRASEEEKAWGREVTQIVEQLLINAPSIIIKSYNYDDFGRVLAEVFYEDNGEYINLSEYMIENNLAVKYLPK